MCRNAIYKVVVVLVFSWGLLPSVWAVTQVKINNPSTWTTSELSTYVGQTIQFINPMYVCQNYSGLRISPRRVFAPTNQAIPLSEEYSTLLRLNNNATVQLSNVSDYKRMGEMITNLVVRVNSTSSVSFISGTWVGNSRVDLQKGYDVTQIDFRDTHSLLVCAMNLCYYINAEYDTQRGPKSATEHEKQRKKISAALAIINADIYGLVEVQQGQDAMAELAKDLSSNTGRKYTYIADGTSVSGTYTKSGYIYCSDVVRPIGEMKNNDSQVRYRKKILGFEQLSNGEKFILSLNHFKAKTGNGTGADADKGDGQGAFNHTRVEEAKSVISQCASSTSYYGDNDILIMGDLNAYAKEDPITTFTQNAYTDLHRYFHADSSYSYVYQAEAGYLDHALCNASLLPQITGMMAFHINSDESSSYAYNRSSDATMFRSSDHDPVLVGLKLDSSKTSTSVVYVNSFEVRYYGDIPYIYNAWGGYYYVYRLDGTMVKKAAIESDEQAIHGLAQGIYLLNIYAQGSCLQTKLIIP